MKYFDEKSDVRLGKKEKREIDAIIFLKKDKYDSRSHFVRCAILKLLREERRK